VELRTLLRIMALSGVILCDNTVTFINFTLWPEKADILFKFSASLNAHVCGMLLYCSLEDMNLFLK
jgi:hypothetical protein